MILFCSVCGCDLVVWVWVLKFGCFVMIVGLGVDSVFGLMRAGNLVGVWFMDFSCLGFIVVLVLVVLFTFWLLVFEVCLLGVLDLEVEYFVIFVLFGFTL